MLTLSSVLGEIQSFRSSSDPKLLQKIASDLTQLGFGVYDAQFFLDNPASLNTFETIFTQFSPDSPDELAVATNQVVTAFVPQEIHQIQNTLDLSGLNRDNTTLTKDQIIERHRQLLSYYQFFIEKRRQYLARQVHQTVEQKDVPISSTVSEILEKEIIEPATGEITSAPKEEVSVAQVIDQHQNFTTQLQTVYQEKLNLTTTEAADLAVLARLGEINPEDQNQLLEGYQTVKKAPRDEQGQLRDPLASYQQELADNPLQAVSVSASQLSTTIQNTAHLALSSIPPIETITDTVQATNRLGLPDSSIFRRTSLPTDFEALSPTGAIPATLLRQFEQAAAAEPISRTVLSRGFTILPTDQSRLTQAGAKAVGLHRGLNRSPTGRASLHSQQLPDFQSTQFAVKMALAHQRQWDRAFTEPSNEVRQFAERYPQAYARLKQAHGYTSTFTRPLTSVQRSFLGRFLPNLSIRRQIARHENIGAHIADIRSTTRQAAVKAGLTVAKKIGSQALSKTVTKLSTIGIRRAVTEGLRAAMLASGALAPLAFLADPIVRVGEFLLRNTVGLAGRAFNSVWRSLTGDDFDPKVALAGAGTAFLAISSLPVIAASVITITFISPLLFAGIIGGFLFFYIPSINIAPLLSTIVHLESGKAGQIGGFDLAPIDPSKIPEGCPNGHPVAGANPDISQGPRGTHSHNIVFTILTEASTRITSQMEAIDYAVGGSAFATHPGVAYYFPMGTGIPTGFGNYVAITGKCEGRQFVTIYAHLAAGNLPPGGPTTITSGTNLGVIGMTGGTSTGVHLHYELLNLGSICQYVPACRP